MELNVDTENLSVDSLVSYAIGLKNSGATNEAVGVALRERLRRAQYTTEEVDVKLDLVAERLNGQQQSSAEQMNTEGLLQPGNAVGSSMGRTPSTSGPSDSGSFDVKDLMSMIVNLQNRLDASEAARAAEARAATAQTPTPGLVVPVPTARKLKVPDPEPFKGDRRDYRRFKLQMQYKLREDAHALGGPTGYIFNRMRDSAANIAISWLDRHPFGTESQFWEFLDAQFADTLAAERARNKLQSYRQKKTSLQTFNAEFMRYAYDAGEDTNQAYLKNRYLHAIREDLQDRMISVDVPTAWPIQQLMDRVVQIEENLSRSRLNSWTPKAPNVAPRSPDAMDWEPTRVATGRPGGGSAEERGGSSSRTRAKWASEQERTKRRERGECLRCGKKGHYSQKCSLLPATKPAQVRLASLQEEGDDGAAEGEDRSEHGSDSEN